MTCALARARVCGAQALEFWNTICEEELDILAEGDPAVPCHNFMQAAVPHLVPILLEQLTKQEEGQEQDPTTWNLSVAAGMCLGLAAQVTGNTIVPLVRANGDAQPYPASEAHTETRLARSGVWTSGAGTMR